MKLGTSGNDLWNSSPCIDTLVVYHNRHKQDTNAQFNDKRCTTKYSNILCNYLALAEQGRHIETCYTCWCWSNTYHIIITGHDKNNSNVENSIQNKAGECTSPLWRTRKSKPMLCTLQMQQTDQHNLNHERPSVTYNTNMLTEEPSKDQCKQYLEDQHSQLTLS